MTTEADNREVSRPCVCAGSCPCCLKGEVIDHHCPNCATEFCPTCHGIAKAIWTRAYDNVSKCHCQPEQNPLEVPKPVSQKGEDVSIYLDIEGRQPAAFRDPALVRGFLKRLARRQEDVVSALRELNKRLSKVEELQQRFNEQLRELKGIYEIEEDEDISELVGDATDG